MSTASRHSPRRATFAAGAILAAVVAAGCGGKPAARDDAPSPPEAATPTPVAHADTSRDGAAFVAIYTGGPYDELRIVRATDGAVVVGGSTRFPDGTRIAVSLLREGPRGLEAVTSSGATVELGRFMSGPLVPLSGPLPQGRYTFRLTTPFGDTDQPPEVLRASDSGRRFEGPGTQKGSDGRIVHEVTLEAPL